jgi:hypothetical protein
VPTVSTLLGRDGPPEGPQSVAAVWTNAVLQKPGAPRTRGFGGLVTFYDAAAKTPVKAKGSLTVYAYDEHGAAGRRAAPDRKYVFTAEQFAKHCGETTMGPSYSIWIPWDKVGGPRREVTLVIRFDPEEGAPVLGAPSRVVLEGTRSFEGQATREKFGVPTRPHTDPRPAVNTPQNPVPPTANVPPHTRQMTTTTLALPPGASGQPRTRR